MHFAVTDKGFGIAPEEQSKLFTPFGQTTSSYHTSEGTGLGLAISQKLVQLMQGEITLNSQLRIGSTFKFSIPLKLGNALTVSSLPHKMQVVGLETRQPHYGILAVDDIELKTSMPKRWLNLLRQAALSRDDETLKALISKVPIPHLQTELLRLIDNFNFEAIANLC